MRHRFRWPDVNKILASAVDRRLKLSTTGGILPVNGNATTQSNFDFRTGRETAITAARFSEGDRAACSALNRQRAKGIQEAARQAPSRQSFTPDVWAALVAKRSREWGVPLIRLDGLGLVRDPDAILSARFMSPLKTGAEASPFADTDWQVVYKLFPLHASGGLGKTFEIEPCPDGQGFEMTVRDAVLIETMEKLIVLHDAGAHPTELVGIDEQGDYLVVKQPLAYPYQDLDEDRLIALERIRAVPCRARFRRTVWILWEHEQAWVLSDLHPGNIMRDADDQPTIIDALLSPLPPALIQSDRLLAEDVEDARALREDRPPATRDVFALISDDDL